MELETAIENGSRKRQAAQMSGALLRWLEAARDGESWVKRNRAEVERLDAEAVRKFRERLERDPKLWNEHARDRLRLLEASL
jgi:hypothetical protein